MNIKVINQQKSLSLSLSKLKALAACLAPKVEALNPERRWSDWDLLVVDDQRMTAVNEAVFGRRQSTDVVSVAYAPVPGAGDWRGEVIVNAQRALQVGTRHGGVAHELALYLAHGLDHLSGADDGTAVERQRMRRRELRWLREERGWPLSGLVVEKERRR